VLQSAYEKIVGTTRSCQSMICRVTWLSMDLFPTTSCGATIKRWSQPQALSQTEYQIDEIIDDIQREYDPNYGE
jgi:hypothetical protein